MPDHFCIAMRVQHLSQTASRSQALAYNDERFKAKRVSTALVDSAVKSLVNHRMNKR